MYSSSVLTSNASLLAATELVSLASTSSVGVEAIAHTSTCTESSVNRQNSRTRLKCVLGDAFTAPSPLLTAPLTLAPPPPNRSAAPASLDALANWTLFEAALERCWLHASITSDFQPALNTLNHFTNHVKLNISLCCSSIAQ